MDVHPPKHGTIGFDPWPYKSTGISSISKVFSGWLLEAFYRFSIDDPTWSNNSRLVPDLQWEYTGSWYIDVYRSSYSNLHKRSTTMYQPKAASFCNRHMAYPTRCERPSGFRSLNDVFCTETRYLKSKHMGAAGKTKSTADNFSGSIPFNMHLTCVGHVLNTLNLSKTPHSAKVKQQASKPCCTCPSTKGLCKTDIAHFCCASSGWELMGFSSYSWRAGATNNWSSSYRNSQMILRILSFFQRRVPDVQITIYNKIYIYIYKPPDNNL